MATTFEMIRRSPVEFQARALETAFRDGWRLVVEYEGRESGPMLVDLSHCPKWDVQAAALDDLEVDGLHMPSRPGGCVLDSGLLLARRSRSQALMWHLAGGALTAAGESTALTEVTDGWCLLALLGAESLEIMARVTGLDLGTPDKEPPFLEQGPVIGIPCQVVVVGRGDDDGAILVACPSGYGQVLADALIEAGAEFGLKPGGERAWSGSHLESPNRCR